MTLRPILVAAALAAAALAGRPVAAGIDGAPRFDLPISCTPGLDCAVQNHVDHDPGPGAADFTCGLLTYDGHKGTDIRLPDDAAIERDVAVLAAARGTVLRVRDAMPDLSRRRPDAPSVAGREAGNSVIIDHGHGWQTQYSHLRRGSVTVEPGQVVMAGTPIGAVGLSGQTEFPHLHFEVRYEGATVDPYTGPLEAPGCDQEGEALWSQKAASALAYRPTGLLAAGLTGVVPTSDGIRAGAYDGDTITSSSEAMVFWVSLFGVQNGDRQTFVLLAPDGAPLVANITELTRAKAEFFAWAGSRKPAYGWRPGVYKATYRLVRGEETIVEVTRSVELP